MNELHLFAGVGGGILGGILVGHTCVCAVEIEPYCQKILLQRQRDGILPKFPIWDDVRTFDGKPWRGKIDIVCGGFPCQDISQANPNANGLNGSRSGLWGEMSRIIGEVRPKHALIENSPMLAIRGLNRVLGDLAGMGFNARWGVFRGDFAGVPQRRARLFVGANRQCAKGISDSHSLNVASNRTGLDAGSEHASNTNNEDSRACALPVLENAYWSEVFNGRGSRGIDGLADRVEREKSIGNGQIPAVVKLAWEVLNEA